MTSTCANAIFGPSTGRAKAVDAMAPAAVTSAFWVFGRAATASDTYAGSEDLATALGGLGVSSGR